MIDKKEMARSYYQRAQNTGQIISELLCSALRSELILAPPTVQMLVGVAQCVSRVVTESSNALVMEKEISDQDLSGWSDELDIATSLVEIFRDQVRVIERIDQIMSQYRSEE